jgi:hypothetical protein
MAASFEDSSYLDWLHSRGVLLSGVTLHHFSDGSGRGVVATRTLLPGETLVSVPDSLVLLAETCAAAPALRRAGLLAKDASPRTQREALVLAIATEQRLGNRSAWAPYLAALPSAEQLHVPCLWSASELSLLAGTVCVERLRGGSTASLDELPCATDVAWRDAALPLAEEEPELRLRRGAAGRRAHAHATALVAAYAFTLGEGASRCQAMVPFWDALNHAHPKLASVRLRHNAAAGRLEMICRRRHACGDQVWNSYGPLGQSELLRRYGFTAPGQNPHDALALCRRSLLAAAVQASDESSVRTRCAALARWLRCLVPRGIGCVQVRCSRGLQAGPLLALRLLLATDDEAREAARALRRGAPPPPAFLGASPALEARVCSAASALSAAALRRLGAPPRPYVAVQAHRAALAEACRASERRCAVALSHVALTGRIACDGAALAAAWLRAARRGERHRVMRSRRGPPDLSLPRTVRSLALAGLLTTRVPPAARHAACALPECTNCAALACAGPFRLPSSRLDIGKK